MQFIRSSLLLFAVLSLASVHRPSPPKKTPAPPRPESRFVTTDRLRLHYLDWGGAGEPVVLLHGLGDDAHRFEGIAPRLGSDFRVLALDWRGSGASDAPTDGYDIGSLVEDLRSFLDAVAIERANLIGHSVAGDQITAFAGKYPARVDRLVYLDAAYDRAEVPALLTSRPEPPAPATDPVVQAIQRGSEQAHPDYTEVRAPALAYFVLPNRDAEAEAPEGSTLRAKWREYLTTRVRPYVLRNAARFRREVAGSCVVMLEGKTHFFFYTEPGRYAEQIRSFLRGAGNAPCRRRLSGADRPAKAQRKRFH